MSSTSEARELAVILPPIHQTAILGSDILECYPLKSTRTKYRFFAPNLTRDQSDRSTRLQLSESSFQDFQTQFSYMSYRGTSLLLMGLVLDQCVVALSRPVPPLVV